MLKEYILLSLVYFYLNMQMHYFTLIYIFLNFTITFILISIMYYFVIEKNEYIFTSLYNKFSVIYLKYLITRYFTDISTNLILSFFINLLLTQKTKLKYVSSYENYEYTTTIVFLKHYHL